jgi:hypothetical protein
LRITPKTVDPDPNTLPKGEGPLYASAAQIYSALDRWALNNPRLFSVYRAVDPVSGESFPVGRLTDSQAPSSKKKRVLITCAVHARELIVPEVCLNLLRLLAAPLAEKAPVLAWSETTAALRKAGIAVRPTTPISGGSTSKRDPLAPFIAAFAQSYDLHVAPLINLSGRMLIEQGGKFSQRKTANGIDINRNFPFGWSDANKDLKSETYPGPYPASQWEVRREKREKNRARWLGVGRAAGDAHTQKTPPTFPKKHSDPRHGGAHGQRRAPRLRGHA